MYKTTEITTGNWMSQPEVLGTLAYRMGEKDLAQSIEKTVAPSTAGEDYYYNTAALKAVIDPVDFRILETMVSTWMI